VGKEKIERWMERSRIVFDKFCRLFNDNRLNAGSAPSRFLHFQNKKCDEILHVLGRPPFPLIGKQPCFQSLPSQSASTMSTTAHAPSRSFPSILTHPLPRVIPSIPVFHLLRCLGTPRTFAARCGNLSSFLGHISIPPFPPPLVYLFSSDPIILTNASTFATSSLPFSLFHSHTSYPFVGNVPGQGGHVRGYVYLPRCVSGAFYELLGLPKTW
jgi:hypothetical protein